MAGTILNGCCPPVFYCSVLFKKVCMIFNQVCHFGGMWIFCTLPNHRAVTLWKIWINEYSFYYPCKEMGAEPIIGRCRCICSLQNNHFIIDWYTLRCKILHRCEDAQKEQEEWHKICALTDRCHIPKPCLFSISLFPTIPRHIHEHPVALISKTRPETRPARSTEPIMHVGLKRTWIPQNNSIC